MAKQKALILSDSKPGHFYQSIGLCLNLKKRGFISDFDILNIPIKSGIDKLLSYTISLFHPVSIIKKLKQYSTDIIFEKYTLIIGTGSTASIYSNAIKNVFNLKCVQILRPLPFLKHDLIFLPFHDSYHETENVFRFLTAFGKIDSSDLLKNPDKLQNRLDTNKDYNNSISILIGGNSKRYKMEYTDIIPYIEALLKRNIPLLFTTSRRTPSNIYKELKNISNNPLIRLSVFVHEEDFNPMPEMFYYSSRIIVTEDSFSMISDSVNSKKPVGILLSNKRKNIKIRKTIYALENSDLVFLIRSKKDIDKFLLWNPDNNIIDSTENILLRIKDLIS